MIDISKNSGPGLWGKAKEIIPGGNQLFSKRPERFLPEQWPSYYSTAKGCEVWDLDGNHYFDFAQMGVGSCVLGYADPDVNESVLKAVQAGSMCSLNCPEEITLAEKILGMHEWADMARFTRCGGEACSVAIRIARAASGKSKIAFCGYHGWHDWYLAANLSSGENLNEHLLTGLPTDGVPEGLEGSAIPFRYNDIDSLEAIASQQGEKLGAIILEPIRSEEPVDSFLEKVKNIASRLNAVLIFDEVTSGFRINMGGAHLVHSVYPDMAIFGKGMSNGYALASVIGKRDVMEAARKTFISSTYWTERIGFTAGIATLEKYEKLNVPKHLIHYGKLIRKAIKQAAEANGINVHLKGIPPLTYIQFDYPGVEALEAQTFWNQEMLKRGYLLGGAIYSTYAYSDEIIKGFDDNTNEVFGMMRKHIDQGGLTDHLIGDIIHTDFGRLA